jgi:flagellar motor protein MotB
MKSLKVILTLTIICLTISSASAQFDLPKKLKKKINKELDKATDDAVDKTVEAVKKGETGKEESKTADKKDSPPHNANSGEKAGSPGNTEIQKNEEELKVWSNYDFVPGEKIIFEDNLAGEEIGEFPSRWDLLSGSAEVATLGEENVIHLVNNNSIIFPFMNKKDFLPEVFTIEFDAFFEKDGVNRSDIYKVRFFEGTSNSKRINDKVVSSIDIKWNEVKMGQLGGKAESFRTEAKNWSPRWKHFAISFNKRSLKVYMDKERLLNVPNLGFKPKMFSIGGHYDDRFIKMSLIKNIRVNEGGKKLYDRIMAEGKFVTRGILFDVNKSSIRGKSMGTINKIVKLMQDHPDLRFRIEGHTDSDGDESYNQQLSEDRAAAVKDVLIQSGVDASRLESRGYGESKPVDENSTPEGKANNRRVEFIKI